MKGFRLVGENSRDGEATDGDSDWPNPELADSHPGFTAGTESGDSHWVIEDAGGRGSGMTDEILGFPGRWWGAGAERDRL